MNKILPVTLVSLSLLASQVQAATASYYGGKFHGRKTASGERFNMYALTAAHNSLPFGTRVKVTNKANGKSVIVKINDRGGFGKYGRTIDLSKKASDMINCGLCKVSLQVL